MVTFPGDWPVTLTVACWVAILLGLTALWVRQNW